MLIASIILGALFAMDFGEKWLFRGASSPAVRLLVGLTVVAPELIVGCVAVSKSSTGELGFGRSGCSGKPKRAH